MTVACRPVATMGGKKISLMNRRKTNNSRGGWGLCNVTRAASSSTGFPKREETTTRRALADNMSSVASPNGGPLADDEQVHLTVFSTAGYMRSTQTPFLEDAFPGRVRCVDAGLSEHTASLASGSNAVCLFVNDVADAPTVNVLADLGVRHIAMRCAGFDRVDLDACRARGVAVTRVPAYSPYAIAVGWWCCKLSLF